MEGTPALNAWAWPCFTTLNQWRRCLQVFPSPPPPLRLLTLTVLKAGPTQASWSQSYLSLLCWLVTSPSLRGSLLKWGKMIKIIAKMAVVVIHAKCPAQRKN